MFVHEKVVYKKSKYEKYSTIGKIGTNGRRIRRHFPSIMIKNYKKVFNNINNDPDFNHKFE